jgi:hypothetical protein
MWPSVLEPLARTLRCGHEFVPCPKHNAQSLYSFTNPLFGELDQAPTLLLERWCSVLAFDRGPPANKDNFAWNAPSATQVVISKVWIWLPFSGSKCRAQFRALFKGRGPLRTPFSRSPAQEVKEKQPLKTNTYCPALGVLI